MVAHTRQCQRCDTEFVTANGRRIYCDGCRKKNSAHKARTQSRNANALVFIGVDGEGVDRPDGTHEYVMLSVGSDTLWDEGRQLTLGAILSFLWKCYCGNPSAAYVGFYLGYDFIQWEKLLPEDRARLLLTNDGIAKRKSQVASRANPYPDAVVVNTDNELWEIDIMAGRRWKMRPHVHHKSAYNSLCRNRTCQQVMEGMEDGPEIGPYEMEWCGPSDDGRHWNGTSGDFWTKFIPVGHFAGSGDVRTRVPGWLYICDTGPFWQTSFLNVIEPSGWTDPVCSETEFETVVTGKSDRGNVYDYGDGSYYHDMQMYNVLENAILARVTYRLNQGFMNDAIPIPLKKAEWYGPGRAAQSWMDMLHQRLAEPESVSANKDTGTRYRVNDPQRINEGGLLNADAYDSMPSWFYEAAQASYYGGWFEQMVHGHCGNVWEYDINSAYPFIIASLPCLHTHGRHTGVYTTGSGNAYPNGEGEYTLLQVHVTGSNPYIGALPYRDRHGRIFRPHEVKGWYWAHEVEAAIRAGLVDTIQVEKWVSFLRCDCSTPFNPEDIGIERMYQLRLEAGKNTPEGKAFKLVYNSAYGKTAQSIGSPKYSNPVYASLITAGCRTLILNAIATHPAGASAVTMVATDGIYFLSKHTSLSLSKTELGAWDETFKPNLTQLMPGVYWDDKTRESIGAGGAPKLKSRGVNAKDLAKQVDRLDYDFARFHEQITICETAEWPCITFHVNFLLHSAKLALQRGKWNTAGKVEHDSTRSISSNPISKRLAEPYRDEARGIIRTRPIPIGDILESTPYSKAFGYSTGEDTLIDRDGGDGFQYFRDLLKTV